MSKNTRNRILLTAVAALLLVVMTVGGTLAWLTDVTPPVTNTFSPSDIHITLKETKELVDGKWSMQLIPGVSKDKDPVVAVDSKTNVPIYVYVKIEMPASLKAVVTYGIAAGWNLQSETTDDATDKYTAVYSRAWKPGDTASWSVLLNDTVSVDQKLTADELWNIEGDMVFTAYAIQQEKFTEANGWTEVLQSMTAEADGNLDGDEDGIAHASDHSYDVEYTPAP